MSSVKQIDDLNPEEQLILGGLIRLMVRTDGSFSEEEEDAINAIGDSLGGHQKFWRMISQSAQAFPDESAVREQMSKVSRNDVQAFILDTLKAIAAADETEHEEDQLLTWVASQWAG